MAQEIELKLALPAASRRAFLRHPLLKEAAETLPGQRLVNIYFDTPDLELRRKRMALRLRKQGRQWLQTVKCAGMVSGGLASRPEWEQPYDGRAFDFSAIDAPEVRKPLEKARDHGRLVAIFETNFLRRTWRFEPSPGSSLLLVLDEGSIQASGRELPLCELEIEIAEGSIAPLFELARRLAERLPLCPDDRSKAERAYRLFGDTPLTPRHAAPSSLATGDTPLAAFRKLAFSCLSHLQGNEEGVLEAKDPEFIHQMRVAIRRLRSALRIFAPILPADFDERFGIPLRDLAATLGAARDWDVTVAETLLPAQKALPDDPRLLPLVRQAMAARDLACQEARLAIASADYGRLLLDLVSALHGLEEHAPSGLPDLAEDRLGALTGRVVKRARQAQSLAPEHLHALRIAVKRLRYAREFFDPLALRGKREISALTKIQSALGRLNDARTASLLLTALAGSELSLHEAAARISGWQRARMAPLLADLPGLLKSLKKMS